ncbi:MAG TPA: alpha/beta fold hydrolase [Kofleriaceae bacterium]|nr:alpha/beta fold hydrolase [Kofleriaceae bacterium]
MKIERLDIAGLTTRVVGNGKQTVVLLHGFGAPGDDLVALAQYIDAPARFVFPEAPLELGGLYGDSRAWWQLDLMRLEQELSSGKPRDRRGEVPEGLSDARDHMVRFLEELEERFAIENSQLVLGGFSQGAMLALDVALHREVAPAGLILMSGTLLAESIWQPLMSKLSGVPVFQSHGMHDQLLPFSIARQLRDQLKAAGARVDWCEFHGGHEIPPSVLDGATKLLLTTGSMSR